MKRFLRLLALVPALLASLAFAADFNGDGKPDLVWSNSVNGVTSLWYMNGPTLGIDATITQIDPSWKIQGIADFNGDGKPDLVWRNTATGSTYVWYMNFSALVSDARLFDLPPEWVIQGVADFNGDGKPDFLLRNTTSGNAFVWFFDDATPVGDQFLFTIDPQWKVEAVADFNGDGQPDLLFRNTSSGLAFAWNTQFSGGTLSLAASSAPIFGIDPVWEIVQTDDWNGDGHPDLVFRNGDTGLVFVWYMNGTTLGQSAFITQIDPVWQIVPRPAPAIGPGGCTAAAITGVFTNSGIKFLAIDRGARVAYALPIYSAPGRTLELLSIQSTSSQADLTAEFAISTCPGKMDVAPECRAWGVVNQSGTQLYATTSTSQVAGICTVRTGVQYYITVTNTKFDRVTPACTPQTCYMVLQLNSY